MIYDCNDFKDEFECDRQHISQKNLKYIKSVGQTKVIRQFLLVFYFTQWNIRNVRPLKRSFAKENLAETSESTV